MVVLHLKRHWGHLPLTNKLLLSSICQQSDVVFYLPTNWGRLPFTLKLRSEPAISYKTSASSKLINPKCPQKCVTQKDIKCNTTAELIQILFNLDIFWRTLPLTWVFFILFMTPDYFLVSQSVKNWWTISSALQNMMKRSFHSKCSQFPPKISASIAGSF